jgi:hypothetical protein
MKQSIITYPRLFQLIATIIKATKATYGENIFVPCKPAEGTQSMSRIQNTTASSTGPTIVSQSRQHSSQKRQEDIAALLTVSNCQHTEIKATYAPTIKRQMIALQKNMFAFIANALQSIIWMGYIFAKNITAILAKTSKHDAEYVKRMTALQTYANAAVKCPLKQNGVL